METSSRSIHRWMIFGVGVEDDGGEGGEEVGTEPATAVVEPVGDESRRAEAKAEEGAGAEKSLKFDADAEDGDGETGEGDREESDKERRGVSMCRARSNAPPPLSFSFPFSLSFSLSESLSFPFLGKSELMDARGWASEVGEEFADRGVERPLRPERIGCLFSYQLKDTCSMKLNALPSDSGNQSRYNFSSTGMGKRECRTCVMGGARGDGEPGGRAKKSRRRGLKNLEMNAHSYVCRRNKRSRGILPIESWRPALS